MEALLESPYTRPLMPKGEKIINTELIESRREALGLSQQAAADLAGLKGGRQQWYTIESGRRESVSLETLVSIARALECQPAELLLPLSSPKKSRKGKATE